MFSLTQVMATSDYLKSKNLRPYVLSRSNFPGLGEYGFHWLGDNWSTVEYLAASVDGMYEYQLFGLPFMGSDICGFDGDAPPDLCTRWH
jgi:alpha-glucosidase (family GH31 glycosyl hydrolase)